MASCLHFLPLFFLTISCLSHKPKLEQNAMTFKVTKDPLTLQYLTHIHKGTPNSPTKLVLDLGGPFLFEACSSLVSSSYRPVHSASLQCSLAKPYSRYANAKTCNLPIVNSITRLITRGELAEDVLSVNDHVDPSGISSPGPISTVRNILFVCAPPILLNGLASGAKGMLGLGRTRTALPSQLYTSRKFLLCVSSSSDGFISSPEDRPKLALSYTPLIPNPLGTPGEYYIKLKSIKVNDRRVSIDPMLLSGGARLSTVVPYTTMESSIYDTFTSAYVSAAMAMNLTRVEPSPPFGVCFRSSGVGNYDVGAAVPVIDFVLQSVMVAWRFHGRNSMVEVGDGVMCMGILDGGVGVSDGVVIGGYQLENRLLEFDLGTSMLGFSSSLLLRKTSCSKYMLSSKYSG